MDVNTGKVESPVKVAMKKDAEIPDSWSRSMFLFVVTFLYLSFFFGMKFTCYLHEKFHFFDSSILVIFGFITVAVLASTIYSQFLSFFIFFVWSLLRGHERKSFVLIKKAVIKEFGLSFSKEEPVVDGNGTVVMFLLAIKALKVDEVPKAPVYIGFNWLLFSLLHKLMIFSFNDDFKEFIKWDKVEKGSVISVVKEISERDLATTKDFEWILNFAIEQHIIEIEKQKMKPNLM